MYGLEILGRTLSKPTRTDRYGNQWQYHSRSDHHSKVACWGLIFDLMVNCRLLKDHVADGRVKFGINHEMRDFRNDRKKNLDLVLCTPAGPIATESETLTSLAENYEIELTQPERLAVSNLPNLKRAPVGSVLLALEAKACMTAHQRALPRLYDELNSSHLTVHGATEQAISAGFVMVNLADRYLSPDLNKKNRATDPTWSTHTQPRDAELAIAKVQQISRRSNTADSGYDAMCVVVVNCVNDGTPVRIVNDPPAPRPGEIYHYESMILRLAHIYATRFKHI